jgi:hypothetical protein
MSELQNMLVSTPQETAYRPRECRATNGADIEIYWMDKGRGVLNFDNVSLLPEHRRPKARLYVLFIFYFFHLGVYEDEPDGKASEMYELFRKLSFQILAATSSNLKFFLVCLSSTKTDVVLSQMKPWKFSSTPLRDYYSFFILLFWDIGLCNWAPDSIIR